eukprot:CAMPEP_0171707352 /NCGR_PEP_ID=MMETSP0991-20121206/14321_1 /TAXON_ID=483369 /ORGANISM="non described non described, Strain CCMP2098" /LENGTH=898 /DNA_ID=CAMNT_0012297231 /DNA_START=1140 /DNA_END=3836 /DNA_ORIENTATION=+
MIRYAEVPELAEDHWAVISNRVHLKDWDPMRLAVLRWNAPPTDEASQHIYMIACMNPSDSRGHRVLVTLTDVVDPRRTFNRASTLAEEAALGAGLALMRQVFAQCGLYAQSFIAGNNALSASPSTSSITDGGRLGVMLIGADPQEPHLIHGHVVARGPPGCCALAGDVPLRAPPPGIEFALKGPKEPYKHFAEAEAVAFRLRTELAAFGVEAQAMLSLQVNVALCERTSPGVDAEKNGDVVGGKAINPNDDHGDSADDDDNDDAGEVESTLEPSFVIGLCRQLLAGSTESSTAVVGYGNGTETREEDDDDDIVDTPREKAASVLWDLSCSPREATSLVTCYNLHSICANVLGQQQALISELAGAEATTLSGSSSQSPRLLELTCGIIANLAAHKPLRRTLRLDRVLLQACHSCFMGLANDPPTLRECSRLFSGLLRPDEDSPGGGGSEGGYDDDDGRELLREVLCTGGVAAKACWVLAATQSAHLVGRMCELLDLFCYYDNEGFLRCFLSGGEDAGDDEVVRNIDHQQPLLGAAIAAAVVEWCRFHRVDRCSGGGRDLCGTNDGEVEEEEMKDDLGTDSLGRLLDLISSTATAASSSTGNAGTASEESHELILSMLPALPIVAEIVVAGAREHSPDIVAKATIAMGSVLLPAEEALKKRKLSLQKDTSQTRSGLEATESGNVATKRKKRESELLMETDEEHRRPNLPVDVELAAALLEVVLALFAPSPSPPTPLITRFVGGIDDGDDGGADGSRLSANREATSLTGAVRALPVATRAAAAEGAFALLEHQLTHEHHHLHLSVSDSTHTCTPTGLLVRARATRINHRRRRILTLQQIPSSFGDGGDSSGKEAPLSEWEPIPEGIIPPLVLHELEGERHWRQAAVTQDTGLKTAVKAGEF